VSKRPGRTIPVWASTVWITVAVVLTSVCLLGAADTAPITSTGKPKPAMNSADGGSKPPLRQKWMPGQTGAGIHELKRIAVCPAARVAVVHELAVDHPETVQVRALLEQEAVSSSEGATCPA